MVYTVYIDVVFAVNTIMDMMVLTILNRVLSYRTTTVSYTHLTLPTICSV